VAPPQTPLRAYSTPPDSLAVFEGPTGTSKGRMGKVEGQKKRRGRGMGRKGRGEKKREGRGTKVRGGEKEVEFRRLL